MNEAAGILKEQKTSVVIFAEGTRSHGEGMREFRSGAAHLAIQTQVPVVPLAIMGSAEALPKDYFSLQRSRVRVVIGEPGGHGGIDAAGPGCVHGEAAGGGVEAARNGAGSGGAGVTCCRQAPPSPILAVHMRFLYALVAALSLSGQTMTF